jgi:hypothetical protein
LNTSRVYCVHSPPPRMRLQDTAVVGSSEGCAVRIHGPGVQENHARIYEKGSRVFCTALTGDADDPRSDTQCWVLPDAHMRAGVA